MAIQKNLSGARTICSWYPTVVRYQTVVRYHDYEVPHICGSPIMRYLTFVSYQL